MKHDLSFLTMAAAWVRQLCRDRRVRLLAVSLSLFAALLLLTGWVLPLSDFADATFLGEDIYDYAGNQTAIIGDVNGDGYDDFLIGARNARITGIQTGGAYLFLGRPAADWGTGFDITQADASFGGEGYLDNAGRDVAGAGDVNGDGYDDFLIGAFSYDAPGAITETGKVYLFLGRQAADWGRGLNLADADASFVGEAAYDWAGGAVAGVGDVNGDGYDDFLVGAYGSDERADAAGKTYLFLGRQDVAWGQNASLANADATFLGEAGGDNAGAAVAGAGDVNGDGYDDFLIGAYGSADVAVTAGEAYLMLGRAAGDWGQGFNLADADAAFLGESSGDHAGITVAGAGDVDGDGLADFLIGAVNNDESGASAGQVYLILGDNGASWGTSFGLANADASFRGAHVADSLGTALSGAGDVNRDGYDDFLIGADHYDAFQALTDSGTAYLLVGKPSGWHMDTDLADAETANDILAFDGEAPGDQAGSAVAGGGDINGDGFADFLVGAPWNDEHGDRAGKVYLVLGRGLILLDKAAHADVVPPGGRITYTLHYSNSDLGDVPVVRIFDRIPAHTSYIRCSGGITCSRQGPLVTWFLGTVVSQTSGTVQMVVRVSPAVSLGTVITNTAWVTAPSRIDPVFSHAVVTIGVAEATPTPTPTSTRTPAPTVTRTRTRTSTPTPTSTPTGCVPSLISPEEGAVLDNGRTDGQDYMIWDFDWSDCPGATAYHLYVIGPTATTPLIDEDTLVSSFYHYVGNVSTSGAYRFNWTWKVRAQADGQWGPWSETRSFDVEPVDTDPPTYWTVYLPIVLKDAMPLPQPAATPTPTATSVEMAFDDGTAESYQSWEVGKGFAVSYASPGEGHRLLGVRLYLLNPAPIQVHVWDKEPYDMITPFTANPPSDGWFDVDLSAQNVILDRHKFYVGFTYLTDYQPDIGVDTDAPYGYSYEIVGMNLEHRPNMDYMIRAVVQ